MKVYSEFRKRGLVDFREGAPFFKSMAEFYANVIEDMMRDGVYDTVDEGVVDVEYGQLKKDLEFIGVQIMDELNDILHEKGLLE